MKKTIFKIGITLLLLTCLASCQETLSYDYLLQHPRVLQKEYTHCRGKRTAYCERVVQAAEDFSALVQQRVENPELFGLQIMRAQQSEDKQKVQVLYAVVRATSME